MAGWGFIGLDIKSVQPELGKLVLKFIHSEAVISSILMKGWGMARRGLTGLLLGSFFLSFSLSLFFVKLFF